MPGGLVVHNRYPEVAHAIRTAAGKRKRDEVTALRAELGLRACALNRIGFNGEIWKLRTAL